MKYFLFTLLFVSAFAHAAVNIKPGLWKINMIVNADGKEMNPAAQMQKAMANMPPERKKMMMEMMSKMNSGMSPDGGMQVCYTKKSLEKPEALAQKQDKNCKTTIVTQTPTKVVTNFKCENGSSGDGTFTMKDSESYLGVMNLDNKGKKSTIKYEGKFVSADCGSVKPVM